MTTILTPMSEKDFSHYLEKAIPAYANDNIEAHRWDESDALERSKQAHQQLLPEGIHTDHHYLFNILKVKEKEVKEKEAKEKEAKEQNAVGHIWVKIDSPNSAEHPHSKSAFIYDIEIYDGHQRKGHATSALTHIEHFIAERGVTRLGLHVFNNNTSAIALYQQCGFHPLSHNMQKAIT